MAIIVWDGRIVVSVDNKHQVLCAGSQIGVAAGRIKRIENYLVVASSRYLAFPATRSSDFDTSWKKFWDSACVEGPSMSIGFEVNHHIL